MNLRTFTCDYSVNSKIVTFQVSPDQLNGIQVGVVWRESQAKMAMALKYLVDDINRCWCVLFNQSVKLVLEHFCVPWNHVSGEPLLHHYFLIGPHWWSVYLNVVVGRVVHYKNALRGQVRDDLVEPLQYRLVIHLSMIVSRRAMSLEYLSSPRDKTSFIASM